MKALMISSMHSGAGKTVMCCALMAALKKKGIHIQAFKSGPDYIDPMFHSRVLGIESRNLDLFLQGETGVRRSFAASQCDFALVEGAMGYYDGLNGGTEASAWELASVLQIPTVLVLCPKGNGITLAAEVRGLQHFRQESRIKGLLLCNCFERQAAGISAMLEKECDLPVLGYLPTMEEAKIESRHLGLFTAGEIADLAERFDCVADRINRTVDLEGILALAAESDSIRIPGKAEYRKPEINQTADSVKDSVSCRIAVARDEAFCFLYEENLDLLRHSGAELLFFSPLRDTHLPECDGLLLCGGYPELYTSQLSENDTLRAEIRTRVINGLPTVAECGGFLYLQENLEDMEGKLWPMCGALPGSGFRTGSLKRFGYLTLEAEEDSLLFRAGDRIPAHEFHYWDSTESGSAISAKKADGRNWRCGFTTKTLYAAFPHLHFGGNLPMAERFVKACMR